MFCFLNLFDLGSSPCFGWSLFSTAVFIISLLHLVKLYMSFIPGREFRSFYLFLENVLHYKCFYTLIVQLGTLSGHMESKKGEVSDQGLDPGGQQIRLCGRGHTAWKKNWLWRESREAGSHPDEGDVERPARRRGTPAVKQRQAGGGGKRQRR